MTSALLEAEAVAVHLQDVDMVGEAVEQSVGEPVTNVQAPRLKVTVTVHDSVFQLPDLGFKGQFAGAHRRQFQLIAYAIERSEADLVHCKEFIGKVVSAFTIYEDSSEGPEICIAFTDGTLFSSCLKTVTSLEAKVTRDDGGQPQLLKDYSTAPVPR